MRTLRLNSSRFLSILCWAALTLGHAGCSDDVQATPDAAPPPDVDAATADASPPPPTSTAFVVAGDYFGTGVASTIEIPDLVVTPNAIAGVASDDPAIRHFGDTLYIINRFGHDNITLIDANALTFIDQLPTGAGSNPQDVAVVGDKLYVAALGVAGVVTIDDQGALDTIDLSALDANDGMPDCNSLYLVGDMLVVTCGLLDGFTAVGPGRVAVIDTNDDSVVDDFALTTANPFGLLRPTPAESRLSGDLLIGTVDFDVGLTTGCIERISVTPPIASSGCLVQNSDLGGYATGLAYRGSNELLIAVTTGFDAQGSLAEARHYDAAGGQLTVEPISGPDERVFDVALCPTGERLFADAAGGIRVYDQDGNQLTQDILDIGLPPVGNGMVCF